jgi:hypothetical protein
MGGVRVNRPATGGERAIARAIYLWVHRMDRQVLRQWVVTGKTVLIAHFRGRHYVLGGFGFHAKGTIGNVWVRVFQHQRDGELFFWLVIDKMNTETGELVRIANFKNVYPDMIVNDVDRVIGRIKTLKKEFV